MVNIAFYDESGNKISDNHNFQTVVRTSGKRVLVYDNGGNSFRVLNKKGESLPKGYRPVHTFWRR